MEIYLRFFTSEEEKTFAQREITNYPNVVPQINSEVLLDEWMGEDCTINFDYYIVKKITYDYGTDIILIDVLVEGRYWDNEWDEI